MLSGNAGLARLAVLLVATAIPRLAQAQDLRGTLGGTVYSGENGRPIAEATVAIPQLGRYASTDSEGRFHLTGVQFGSYLVQARALGPPGSLAVGHHRPRGLGRARIPAQAGRHHLAGSRGERQPRPRTDVDYSGNEMELAPRFLGNGRISYRPAFLSAGVLALEWVRLGSYWMDPENTHKYEGHDLFNLYGTVPVTQHLELSGRVTNLTDKRFAETSSFNAQQGERFRPGAPRQFFLGAQYRLGDLR